MRCAVFILCLLPLLFGAVPSLAEEEDEKKKTYLYQWTDERGAVHITDEIGKVPEKYRSKAREMETTRPEDEGAETGAPPPFYHQTPPPAVNENANKAEWQTKIAHWKQRLADAEQARDSLNEEREGLFRAWGSAAMAPIANRERAEEIGHELEKVQQQIDEARNMLDVVIPDDARRAGVPPGWLRE